MTTATLGRIFASLTAGVLVLFSKDIYRLVIEYIRSSRSPLRRLPGPKPQRFLGNIKELMDPNPALVHEKWVEEHGHAFKAHSVLNIITLFLVDPRAVSYVLAHDTEYPMPAPVLRDLSRMLGDGLLVVQGEQHRRERRVMSPAFGPGQIRELQSIFLQKCTQLRDIWIQSVKSGEATRGPDGCLRAQVEATEWLNKMTLDVIGLAGFDSSFNALSSSDTPSELNQVLRTMLMTGNNPSLLDFLHAILPITRFIKSQADRNILRAREVTDRVGRELISKAKSAVTEGRDAADISRKDFEAKDMLTLLIRANMAQDVPNGAKLSDEEVISQIPTMLFAGYETTSAALACALYALACNADIQDTLRAEVLACADGDAPSVDTLNKLPYLDKFIRETLRLYSPATVMVRTATKDDVIPTGEDWADQTGVKHSGIHITKDETLMIPILAMNRSKRIWGEDAYQFKPERWANVPEAVAAIPGVWGNSLTFSGGSRACIGYRFAVAEMKTTIYTLLRSLRFSLAADPADIKISVQGITRSVIRDKPKDGAYLPLWVTVLEDEPAF